MSKPKNPESFTKLPDAAEIESHMIGGALQKITPEEADEAQKATSTEDTDSFHMVDSVELREAQKSEEGQGEAPSTAVLRGKNTKNLGVSKITNGPTNTSIQSNSY